MSFMGASSTGNLISRRQALAMAVLSLCPHLAANAAPIYTPYEVAEQFERRVATRLRTPKGDEERLYTCLAELHLLSEQQALIEPQYLLLVDRNPHVQSALLAWRLASGAWKWLGAVPVSTGIPNGDGQAETPRGLFDQSQPRAGDRRPRTYDFRWQRAFQAGAPDGSRSVRLEAADRKRERQLGIRCTTDGCILLPASMAEFLDEFGLLDGDEPPQPLRRQVPYRGRYLLIIDSEREDRPDWSLARA